MEGEMKHFSHVHPLILKSEEHKTDDGTDPSDQIITCDGCSAPISAPFYSCGECVYFLHKDCAELPNEINHPMHPKHPLTLTLRSYSLFLNRVFQCNKCRKIRMPGKRFVYNCSLCNFALDPICASASGYRVRNKGMEKEMTHFSHDHPLILKAEEHKTDDATNQSVEIIKCNGCATPISAPFYSCGECGYLLHKVCAELPSEMKNPMHPQHPLSLISRDGQCLCNVCRNMTKGFFYRCSLCNKFNVELICASASHAIEDKCHQHPLTPIQHLIPLPCCHICQTQEKGFSYKCNICPFWVHQKCTVSLPRTVKHSYHPHILALLQSVPQEYEDRSRKCDICNDRLFTFHCVYYCERCQFFAHISCTRSEPEVAPRLLSPSDQDLQPNGQPLALLPQQLRTTDLISWFAENYSNQDAISNLLLGITEGYVDRETNIKIETNSFGHRHPLFLMDDQVSEQICDACACPISTPYYGGIDCGYFLHKCCAKLPKHILHPAHPQHQISLYSRDRIFWCKCCYQCSNGFGYKCFQCGEFEIDINCASLLRHVKHEAHKHPLIPTFRSSRCIACDKESDCILQCNTCKFSLCFRCAMAPSTMNHRYDKHPFKLTYFPPENHYNEYICDLCEKDLNPKHWFYHCDLCDQFTHTYCMLDRSGVDSKIKYGKRYKFKDHKHGLMEFSDQNIEINRVLQLVVNV